MNKLKYFALTLAAAFMLISSACGSDAPDPTPPSPIIATDRAYIENAGKMALELLKPADQSAVVVALCSFVDQCKKYTFPDKFYDDRYAEMSRAAEDLAEAIENYDFPGMSRAVSELIYTMERFKGFYQPNEKTGTWEFIENREGIAFRYWHKSTEYNITLEGQGGNWGESAYLDNVVIRAEIPKDLILSIFSGSSSSSYNTLASVNITSNARNNDFFNLSISGKVANIYIESTTKGSQDRISETSKYSTEYNKYPFNITMLLEENTLITGRNLSAAESWGKITNDLAGLGQLANMVSTVSNSVQVMDQLKFNQNITDMYAFIDAIDMCWDEYVTDHEATAREAAEVMETATNGDVYFTASAEPSRKRGTMGWEAYQKANSNQWSIRPTITFEDEGVKYAITTYFGNNQFEGLKRDFNTKMKTYKSFWS